MAWKDLMLKLFIVTHLSFSGHLHDAQLTTYVWIQLQHVKFFKHWKVWPRKNWWKRKKNKFSSEKNICQWYVDTIRISQCVDLNTNIDWHWCKVSLWAYVNCHRTSWESQHESCPIFSTKFSTPICFQNLLYYLFFY